MNWKKLSEGLPEKETTYWVLIRAITQIPVFDDLGNIVDSTFAVLEKDKKKYILQLSNFKDGKFTLFDHDLIFCYIELGNLIEINHDVFPNPPLEY